MFLYVVLTFEKRLLDLFLSILQDNCPADVVATSRGTWWSSDRAEHLKELILDFQWTIAGLQLFIRSTSRSLNNKRLVI